jgi:hypothetical protein
MLGLLDARKASNVLLAFLVPQCTIEQAASSHFAATTEERNNPNQAGAK